MPRMQRIVAPGVAHHITQRGNNRRAIFETNEDRLAYLGLLHHYSRIHQLRILGYCLMPNHVHLIAMPDHAHSMPRTLQSVHGRYSAYLNARQARTGHLWQARYFSCPMDDNHLWTALRYVELNPVRAGLASSPQGFHWSSAASHCGGGMHISFLDLEIWAYHWTTAQWSEFLSAAVSDEEANRIQHATHTGRGGGAQPNKPDAAIAAPAIPAITPITGNMAFLAMKNIELNTRAISSSPSPRS
jgi:putative transposase